MKRLDCPRCGRTYRVGPEPVECVCGHVIRRRWWADLSAEAQARRGRASGKGRRTRAWRRDAGMVYLRVRGGLTYAEIAAAYGVDTTTARRAVERIIGQPGQRLPLRRELADGKIGANQGREGAESESKRNRSGAAKIGANHFRKGKGAGETLNPDKVRRAV